MENKWISNGMDFPRKSKIPFLNGISHFPGKSMPFEIVIGPNDGNRYGPSDGLSDGPNAGPSDGATQPTKANQALRC